MTTFEENELLITPVPNLLDLEAVVPRWRALLEYEPDTGLLRWRYPSSALDTRLATRGKPGKRGYLWMDGNRVWSADAVWLLHHGAWPDGELRHRDKNLSNDRIENLEPIDPAAKAERKRRRPVGVARYGARWQAYYRDPYTQKFLGVFDTEEQAAAARAAYDRGDDLV